MRRYGIVFGILLTLSILDFALAVPVLVQEKRQARPDVVRIPKDVTTMLGKRSLWDKQEEELKKALEDYYDRVVGSSDAHASSSSAVPASKPASPPADADSSSESDIESESEDSESEYESHDPIGSPTSTLTGPEPGLTGIHASEPDTNTRPSSDPGIEAWTRMHLLSFLDDLRSSNEFGETHDDQVPHAPAPNSEPSIDDITHLFLFGPDHSGFGVTDEGYVVHFPGHEPNPEPFDPGTPNRGPFDPGLPTDPGNSGATAPSPNQGSPSEPDHEIPSQRPSTEGQPVDPAAAAMYALKGKAKLEEDPTWIPGTSGSSEN